MSECVSACVREVMRSKECLQCVSERYVYVTPIRLGLLKTTNENAPCLRIKVNHVRENFIPNLEQLSLVFYKQNRYSCIGLILTLPILLTIG